MTKNKHLNEKSKTHNSSRKIRKNKLIREINIKKSPLTRECKRKKEKKKRKKLMFVLETLERRISK